MKKQLFSIGVSLLLGFSSFSQNLSSNSIVSNASINIDKDINSASKNVPTYPIPAPNLAQIQAEDEIRDHNGVLYRIGVNLYTNLTTNNSGIWTTLSNGDKMWQLAVKSKGAEALSFIFNNFILSSGSVMYVQDRLGKKVSKVLNSNDMQENLMQNIALCFGDDLILTLIDKNANSPSTFTLERVIYNYRSTGNPNPPLNPQKINEAGSCEVNVNCPEGASYQDEKHGVVRVYVVESSGAGWCSGSLVNNTSQDCKPLLLTALHCGPAATTSATNMTLWKFYFNYEAPTCTNPTSVGTLANYYVTGCVRLADSNDYTTDIQKDDFLLVQMGTLANEASTITTLKSANYNAYWNGWDANATAAPNGIGIHHPAGDIKKISTFTSPVTSDSYSGTTLNTHWKAVWATTTTNYGVTEGGSSGSPLFTGNSGNARIIGTLSGGPSGCTVAASSKYDLYGKMSMHWTSDGTTSALSLKYHLDPGNTGALVMDGSYNPCAVTNTPPVASFNASNTTPCMGASVTLTDMSTNAPTSWSWSISPSSFSYTGGTSATSQNPHVIFNAAGPYTVSLTATNAYGNNSSTQTSYISPMSGSTLPFVENFEGATFPPTGWTIENADAPSIAWGTAGAKGLERRAAGNTGSATGCAGIEFFNYSDSSQVDNLISLPINLSGATAPKMTFKRSYKYYNSSTAPTKYHDELKIYVSTDCGSTWSSALYFKKGSQLATNGTINTTFTPSLAADWDIDTVDLTAYAGQSVKIKFEAGNRYGNNLYIDDINVTNVASATATVAITSSDADNTICAGTSVTFTATPTNGGATPTYQWKVNGVNVGTNSSTYTTTTLTTGASVTCLMTSNLSGVIGSPATSNAIVTTVNAIPSTPTVTTNSPVCQGSSITLTTSTVSGATYAWTGPSYSGSTQNPTLTNATTAMAGAYNLTVTVNGCTSTVGTSTVSVTSSVTPSVSIAITAGGNPTCASQSVTYTATPTNGGTTPAYQWKVNGVNAGTNSSTFTPGSISNNDLITCVLTSNATCVSAPTATSSGITMTVTTTVTPAITIAASSTTICTGTSVTFTPTPSNGGTTPTYQWKLNGTNVSTSSTYTSSSLSNGDVVTCVMTSNSSCASPSTGTSNSVTITVSSSVTPSVSIAASSTTICPGTSVTFTPTPANGGTIPTYQWKLNGTNVSTSSTYTTTTLANGDVVTCVMTSNSTCASPSTGTSNSVTMTVSSGTTPSVSIAETSGSNPSCSGSAVTFTATPTSGGTTPTYQWQVNGTNAGTGSIFTTSSLTNGSSVTCVMTSNATCLSTPTATSSPISMQISSSVTPSLAIVANTNPACTGSYITFTATPTNGGTTPSYQWKLNGVNVGTNNASYGSSSLANGDVVTCVITSNASCVSTPTATSNSVTLSMSAAVTPSVVTSITTGQNPLCQGDYAVFTASGSNGGTSPSYQWQVNNVNVGTNYSSYGTSTLNNGDVVSCVMTSNAGCITTSTASSTPIAMTVNQAPATPTITENGNVLTSSASSGNQWYLNGVAIVGAVGPTYTPTQNGNYTVVATNGGCTSSPSAVTTISSMSLDDLSIVGNHFNIYPNPTNGKFTVVFTSTEFSKFKLELHNAIGQVVFLEDVKDFNGFYTKDFDVTEYGKGEYYISISSSKRNKLEKVIVY